MARYLLSLSLIVALLDAASAQNPSAEGPFAFALIADMPYSPVDSVRFGRLVEEINRAEGLEWVIHVGDIKGGSSPCSDGLLQNRFEWFQQFERPFILAPGDNDWTDCHRSGYQPLDRLSARADTLFSASGLDYRPASHARRHSGGHLPRARALDPREDELCGAAHRRQ